MYGHPSHAQNPSAAQTKSAPPPTLAPQPLPPPQGQVIIQSHGEPPAAPGEPGYETNPPQSPAQQPVVGENAKADVTDADRAALLITAYDLDARVSPARYGLSMRALIAVRNTGTVPLKQLALQISSTLHWDSATLVDGAVRTHLALAQHQLDTDTDHTGAEDEAILPLPEPLAPGASAKLDLFYSGTIAQSAGRLQRLGANAAQQVSADWDAISPAWTGVRGFGNVLWYPVASPQYFLADGNTLFEAIGRTRLHEEHAAVHLRLSVEYLGDAPAAAYFCGRREALKAVSDDPDAPVNAGAGVATAEFAAEPLGFRTPSLFLIQQPETLPGGEETRPETASPAGASSSSSSSIHTSPPAPDAQGRPADPVAASGPPFLAVETSDPGTEQGIGAASERVAPLLREWLGPRPLSALTAIDHPGQPFQDGPLLVAPLAVLQTSPESPALVESLTHAWIQTGQPWMDEGLAQFFALLWMEREQGHAAANAELSSLMAPVATAEPDLAAGPNPLAGQSAGQVQPSGQPLIDAQDDLFYRRKAAAVWWMLRGIVGDGNLHQALSAWRTQAASQAPAAQQAVAFEHLLEKLSGADLSWFFADWVLHDRGLPDLTITDVAAAAEPAGTGHGSGYVVAVTVRNAGGAVADVPLILLSGNARTERRIRVPGLSSRTERVLVETAPTSVQVNDGSTPEVGESTHIRPIDLELR